MTLVAQVNKSSKAFDELLIFICYKSEDVAPYFFFYFFEIEVERPIMLRFLGRIENES